MIAPIALFVYNRPTHTKLTIDALANNLYATNSELIVFSDGPKTELDKELVAEVRNFIRTISSFKSIRMIESAVNKGLARSIIEGVTEVLKSSETIIVLEDDLVTSPYFLQYMNEGLDFYQHEERVISIHAYMYPVKEELPATFFIRGADCWGWATWKKKWELFEPDGAKLLRELKNKDLTREFDFDGSYPYVRMLKDQIRGRNNSWAIRWYASAFIHEKLTLYPGKSYLQNIGNDASGTHSRGTNQFIIDELNVNLPSGRISIKEDIHARRVISAYFYSIARNPIKKFIGILMFLWRK